MGYTLQIHRRKVKLSLEPVFWECLKEIAVARGQTISELAADIVGSQSHFNLTSAFRVFILDQYRAGPARVARHRPSPRDNY